MSIGGSSYEGAESQSTSAGNISSGEMPPLYPTFNPEWKLKDYQNEVENYLRKLHDYLRRLSGKIQQVIKAAEGTDLAVAVDWKYDNALHKFQVKVATVKVVSIGVAAAWQDASGTQPSSMSNVQTDSSYSTSTHVLDKTRTANVYVLEKGSGTTSTVETAEAYP